MRKNEHKIEWLSRYGQALCKLKRLEEDYNEFVASFSMCKSPIITDMPTGSHDDAGLEKYFPKMEEYEKEIRLEISYCNQIRQEIREAINCIAGKDAETYISVLTYRYIMRWSWIKISQEMHMSYDHVKGYLHGRALEKLNVNTP